MTTMDEKKPVLPSSPGRSGVPAQHGAYSMEGRPVPQLPGPQQMGYRPYAQPLLLPSAHPLPGPGPAPPPPPPPPHHIALPSIVPHQHESHMFKPAPVQGHVPAHHHQQAYAALPTLPAPQHYPATPAAATAYYPQQSYGHYASPPPTSQLAKGPPVPSNAGDASHHASTQQGATLPYVQPRATSYQPAGGASASEKKRVKTGCITCRKRRIKCSEEKPYCRNCEKSKRECLGYDHLTTVRPSSPARLQPAPPSEPSWSQSPQASYSHSVPVKPTGTPVSYTPAPFPVAHRNTQTKFEHGPPQVESTWSGNHPPMARDSRTSDLLPQRTVVPVTIEELFALNDIPANNLVRAAPPPDSQPSSEELRELDDFYRFHYAVGLDRFFETTWYSVSGLAHLRQNRSLQDFVMQCAERMKDPAEANSKSLQSLEARLVWELAIMPRHMIPDAAGQELLPRINAVEKLMTGQFLTADQIPPAPPAAPPSQKPDGSDARPTADALAKHSELAFWHALATFTNLHDDTDDAATMQVIGATLQNLRSALYATETRDLLYSLAVLRHIGGRMAAFYTTTNTSRGNGQPPLVASTNDPADDVGKLVVAQNNLLHVERAGSSQVSSRFSAMALRGVALQKKKAKGSAGGNGFSA